MISYGCIYDNIDIGIEGKLFGSSLLSRKPFSNIIKDKWIAHHHHLCLPNHQPNYIYEVDEIRNINLSSIPELNYYNYKLRKKESHHNRSIYFTHASELNAIPCHSIAKNLLNESINTLYHEEINNRKHFLSNRLQTWQLINNNDILLFHSVGAINEKISLSIFKEDLNGCMDIHHIKTVECDKRTQYQICLQPITVNEALIASRSKNIISLFHVNDNYELYNYGYCQSNNDITDISICPYMYPELCYGNIDGSLYTVDLIQSQSQSHSHSHSQEYLISQNIIESMNINDINVLCEYGMGPRHIFMSRNDKLLHIDLRENCIPTVVYTTLNNEWYTDLKTSKSNQNSSIKNNNLLVALSNKKIYLHDVRLLTEPVLSWNIPDIIKDPQCCQFFLNVFNDDIHDENIINIPDDDSTLYSDNNQQQEHLCHIDNEKNISMTDEIESLKHLKGHIIVGDLINGDFIQAVFSYSDAPITLTVENNKININYNMKNEGYNVKSERFIRSFDLPSLFCEKLRNMKDYESIAGCNIKNFLSRFYYKYGDMRYDDYYVLDYEIRQYMEELEYSIDCYGISYIPDKHLLFRLNSVNDIIVNKCKTYNEASKNEMNTRYKDLNVRPLQFKNESKNKLNIKTLKECPLVPSPLSPWLMNNMRYFDIKKSTLYCERDNVSVYKNKKNKKAFIMYDCIPKYLGFHHVIGDDGHKSVRHSVENENMCFNYLCGFLKIKTKHDMKLSKALSNNVNINENHLLESFANYIFNNKNIILNSSTLWEIHHRGFMLSCSEKENDDFFWQIAEKRCNKHKTYINAYSKLHKINNEEEQESLVSDDNPSSIDQNDIIDIISNDSFDNITDSSSSNSNSNSNSDSNSDSDDMYPKEYDRKQNKRKKPLVLSHKLMVLEKTLHPKGMIVCIKKCLSSQNVNALIPGSEYKTKDELFKNNTYELLYHKINIIPDINTLINEENDSIDDDKINQWYKKMNEYNYGSCQEWICRGKQHNLKELTSTTSTMNTSIIKPIIKFKNAKYKQRYEKIKDINKEKEEEELINELKLQWHDRFTK